MKMVDKIKLWIISLILFVYGRYLEYTIWKEIEKDIIK